MKNKFLKPIILSTAMATFFVACDRNLDQYSSVNEPSSTALNSSTAFRMAMDGVYSSMKQTGYYASDAGSQLIIADVVSDNLVSVQAGRQSNYQASYFEFAADNSQTTGLYTAAYNVISKANFVLSNLDNGVLSANDKANISAEARAIRAMAHFDIVRAYAKIPTQSSDAGSSVGIYYSESFEPTNKDISRNLTVNQVYDKILADLQYAAANITNTSETDKGRLSKAAIYGLLSRVYLYKGDYANTISTGEQSLQLSPSITTLANFKNIWKSTAVDGVLFQILNSTQEGVTVGVAYNQTLSGGIRSEFVPDYDLFNKYSTSDIRTGTYFTTSNYSQKTYNNITKYSSVGTSANVVPIKYIRSAEVLLNVAEAYYKSGNSSKALALLNQLRAQRYTNYTPGTESGSSILDAIYLQRRLELAFENDRWYTLKRLGLPVQRSGKGDLADGSGRVPTEQTLVPTSFKWQWPIPQSAILKNTKIVQNSGY